MSCSLCALRMRLIGQLIRRIKQNRLALHIDVTGRATSRLMLDTSGPPNVVANAQAESADSLSLDIQARGRSDSVLSLTNVSPARVLTRSIKSGQYDTDTVQKAALADMFFTALDLGLYNYMPKLSTLAARPPISPTATTEHTRTRTGSLFGGTSTLGKNTIRNSVFGGAMTPIHDSKRTDTVRSGASTSTAGDSHVSSLFSNGHTPSTLASSTMSEHDESMVMVQRDPSYEEMWRKSPGMTGRLTKSPPLQSSGIPRKVTDESLLRANRLGSIGSISQMLEPHGVANVKESVSDDNMGRSQSMDELRASEWISASFCLSEKPAEEFSQAKWDRLTDVVGQSVCLHKQPWAPLHPKGRPTMMLDTKARHMAALKMTLPRHQWSLTRKTAQGAVHGTRGRSQGTLTSLCG